jgi:predicted component of type VI protein secretion system
MKNQKNAIISIGILILVLVGCDATTTERNKETKSEIQNFIIPIYIGAKNIKYYTLKNEMIKGVSYEVKLPYDSKEVLEFYDKEMRQIGYNPFVEDYYKYADRIWQTFVDSTKKGEPYVAQLIANWVDSNHTKRARLVLNYYWYVNHQKPKYVLGFNEDLNVDFQIMQFVKLPPPAFEKDKEDK